VFVVLGLQLWDASALEGMHVQVEGPGIGFLPVYESREEAEHEHPERAIIEVSYLHCEKDRP
jgi:hypothetical protein